MAENAIEILINVATEEGVESVDDFMSVISDAAKKVGVLSDTIDDLDSALAGIAKSGASAEDMAAAVATALEDVGVESKDTEAFVATLASTLTKLGVSGEKAASGVDLATKANEGLAGSADTATAAVSRQTGAVEALGVKSDATAAALKGFEASAVASSIAAGAAVEDLGVGFTKMTTLSEMATPALMKAATWAGVGLAGLAYEGIKQYTQFNKLITQTITQAGVAPSKMGFLTNLAESVAKSTGQNLDDVANTIYRAASGTASWNAGLGATKAQLAGIVTTVSKLNIVGGIASGAESEQSSRVITALLNSDIRGVGKSPISAAALVNAVVGSGDIRYSDLVPAVGRGLLASAVANNLSAKDALAWVDTLTSQGTTGSVAGNYVKTGINLLAHPSAQGVDALAMLGIKPGELENLMTGPGGLTSALSTLKQGMTHLNPGSAATFFYHEAGVPYPGSEGLAGAVAKLQTWSAGELSPTFIKNWEARKLTPQEQTQATDLILTKAFGGSKQFATIAGVLNNLNLFKGIEGHISAEDTPGYFNAQYRRTEATPSVQFRKMGQNLLVDLVNIGHTLTPLALTFGHVMTDVIDGLSKFKGVLYGFAAIAVGLLGAAGIGKAAQLITHLSPLIGAGYNRLGSMAGDSAFGNAMTDTANSGRFKFLNIYASKKHGLLSKLGGESINANGVPSADSALSPDGTALNTNISKSNVLLEQIATNTRVTAGAAEEGDMTGGGLAKAGGRGGAPEAAVEREASMATYTPRDAMYMGSASGLSSDLSGMEEGSIFYNASSGRWTKQLAGGRQTFVSKEEAYRSGAMNGPPALGAGNPEDASVRYGGAGGADSIALPEESLMGGVDTGMQYGPALEGGLANAAVPELLPAAGEGMLSGLGETLGGIAGGPIGMMGMMMAPMLLGALTPALGKLGSLLSGWFGGGKQPVFHAKVKHALDSVQASAKQAADLKVLRQFQTRIKNKAGKEEWIRSQSAYLADPLGYDKALKKYQLASHTYTGSIRNSEAIASQAIDALYGGESGLLSRDRKLAKGLSGHLVTQSFGRDDWTSLQDVGTAAQMRQLASKLPVNVRGAVLSMMNKNGANWQDFSKIINKQQSLARGTFADIAGSSAQFDAKHYKEYAALNNGGFFTRGQALSLNTKEMDKALSEKGATVAKATQFLPQYAHQFHLQMVAAQKALVSSPPDAKAYFEDQRNSARDSLKKADELINEMHKASDHTKLDGESVSKLAQESAKAIAASGLTALQIGTAVAAAISPYMKTSKVQGTSSGTTRTVYPVPANG